MSAVHLDYETRSKADLTAVGAYRYACDPSTEVFMASVSADGSPDIFLWVNPKFQTPDLMGQNDEAVMLLRNADCIYAHGAPFEHAITWGTRFCELVGIHPIQIHQWRCTMAMARKAGLPQSLAQCGAALGIVEQKDPVGKKLINFFSKPKEDGTFNEPRDFPDKWAAFGAYCVQDNRAEKEIHLRLRPFELQGDPLETFLFDLRMNMRGIPVNVPALRKVQRIIDLVQEDVTVEFQRLTSLNPTQREAVRDLVGLPNMQAETIEATLAVPIDNPLHEKRNEILRLYQKVSYAAVKKVATMLDWACPDSRMRGVLKYYGAGTGRWSAGGPQIQNAKSPTEEIAPMTDAVYRYIADWDMEDCA